MTRTGWHHLRPTARSASIPSPSVMTQLLWRFEQVWKMGNKVAEPECACFPGFNNFISSRKKEKKRKEKRRFSICRILSLAVKQVKNDDNDSNSNSNINCFLILSA